MTIKLVRNEEEANEVIRELLQRGCLAENIYALAHDKKRTAAIAEDTEANQIGVSEQGVIRSIANLFRSRGEELIVKMESLGLSREDAVYYEQKLDEGDILIVTWPSEIDDYNPELERERGSNTEYEISPLILAAGVDPSHRV